MDAFISHSSKNHALAAKVAANLTAAGLDVWLDDTDITLGALLRAELQAAIERCRVLVLLWSKAASRSRWINAEWLTAYHLDTFIVPCTLDDTALPQCLRTTIALPIARLSATTLKKLVRAVREAPASRNALGPPMRSEFRELKEAIATLSQGQTLMTGQLGSRKLEKAAEIQSLLDATMARAVAIWPLDPMIVNLDGYHLKNAYMLKHWDAIQAGRAPADELLERAERRFFETLSIDPTDPSALNGLGSVLILERALDAAKFFVTAAIAAAKAKGMASYPAAQQDLKLIEYYKAH